MEQLLKPAVFPQAFLESEEHRNKLRSSLWLYLTLLSMADAQTGRFQTTAPDLARILGKKPETIESQLGRLQKAGYVRVERDSGWLRIVVANWPASEAPPVPREVQQGDDLARRLAVSLGDEASLGTYQELVETIPRSVLEGALRDALSVPKERIRTSRPRLFHYLTNKLYAQHQEETSE